MQATIRQGILPVLFAFLAGFAFGEGCLREGATRLSSESSLSPSPPLSAPSSRFDRSRSAPSETEEFVTGVDGNLKQVKDRSGIRDQVWEYDRLELATYSGPGVLSGYQLDPQFDDQGRRTGVILRKGGSVVHQVTFARGDPNASHSRQLTGASTSWMNATYRRDPVNHWITDVDRGGADLVFQRDGKRAGRLVRAESTVPGAPSFKYQRFDALGRRTYVRSSQGNWTYRYSANGHLGIAQNSSGPDFSYDVDAIGRRRNFRDHGGMSPGDASAWTLNQPAGSFGGQDSRFHLRVIGAKGTKFFLRDPLHPNQPLTPEGGSDYQFNLATEGTEVDEFHLQKNLSQYPYGGWYRWSIKGVLEDQGDPGAHEDAVSQIDGLTWINPTYGSYSHDADGNQQSAPGWHYRFDGRNRLVGAETEDYASNPTGTRLTFEYDSDGRRVQKTVTTKETASDGQTIESTLTTHFVWDGWDLLYECQQDNGGNVVLERRYVWGADLSGTIGGAGGAGGLLAYQEIKNGQAPEVFYPLYDGRGNVVGLADESNVLVAEYRYGPFGELIEAKGSKALENPWRFATKYQDLETNLTYFGFRYFDSVTGSWLSREPLGESESLNLYAYCHGDPINKVDVLGLRERTVLAPDNSSEIYNAAKFWYNDGHWHVLVRDIHIDNWTGKETTQLIRYVRVISDDGTPYHKLKGYNLYGLTPTQGPTPTAGSRLITEAARIAAPKLLAHRKWGTMTLAAGSAVFGGAAVLTSTWGTTATGGAANKAAAIKSWYLANASTVNIWGAEGVVVAGGIGGFDGVPASPGGAVGTGIRRTGGQTAIFLKNRFCPITGLPVDETFRVLHQAPNKVTMRDPSELHGSHPVKKSTPFVDTKEGTVGDLTERLKKGEAGDVPPIEIAKVKGKEYSANNKRLKAYQDAGVEVPTVPASKEQARKIKQRLQKKK